MKYFVFDHERKGTNYYEFYKGKWDGKTFWHPKSISIHDDIIFKCPDFVDAIVSVIPDYNPFGETEINKKQWVEIGHTAVITLEKKLPARINLHTRLFREVILPIRAKESGVFSFDPFDYNSSSCYFRPEDRNKA